MDENRIESPTYSELSTNTCDAHLYELSLHPHFIPFLYQVKPKFCLLALTFLREPHILRPYMHIFLSSYMLPSCKRTWMWKTHHKSRSFSSGNHRCSTSFSMCTGYLPVFGVSSLEPRRAIEPGIAWGCLQTYAVTEALLLAPKPPSWSFEQMAAWSVTFATTEEAFQELAPLKRLGRRP